MRPSLNWSQSASLLLDGNRQFFAIVLAVNFGLGCALLAESCLFSAVVKLASQQVEVIALPELLGRLSLHDLVVALDFEVVVDRVLVGDHVVFPRNVQTLERVLFSLQKLARGSNLPVRWGQVSFRAAGSGAPACRCSI